MRDNCGFGVVGLWGVCLGLCAGAHGNDVYTNVSELSFTITWVDRGWRKMNGDGWVELRIVWRGRVCGVDGGWASWLLIGGVCGLSVWVECVLLSGRVSVCWGGLLLVTRGHLGETAQFFCQDGLLAGIKIWTALFKEVFDKFLT